MIGDDGMSQWSKLLRHQGCSDVFGSRSNEDESKEPTDKLIPTRVLTQVLV